MCGQQRTKHTHTHTKQLHEPHQTPTAEPKVHEQILVLVPEKPRVPAAVAYAFCLTSTSEASTAPLSAVAMIFLSALNASGYAALLVATAWARASSLAFCLAIDSSTSLRFFA